MTEASLIKLINLSITALAGLFGGISMSAAFALGGLVAMGLRIDLNQTDIALGLGYLVGACSISVITWCYFRRKKVGY